MLKIDRELSRIIELFTRWFNEKKGLTTESASNLLEFFLLRCHSKLYPNHTSSAEQYRPLFIELIYQRIFPSIHAHFFQLYVEHYRELDRDILEHITLLMDKPLSCFTESNLSEISEPLELQHIVDLFCQVFSAIEPFQKLHALLKGIDRLALSYPQMSADDLIPLLHYFIVRAISQLSSTHTLQGIFAHCAFLDDCVYKSGNHSLQILSYGKDACCLTHFQVAMGLMTTPQGRSAMTISK